MPERMNKDRGGVVPYYIKDGTILMMFMKPSDKNFGGERFQIAKGKIEKGVKILAEAIK